MGRSSLAAKRMSPLGTVAVLALVRIGVQTSAATKRSRANNKIYESGFVANTVSSVVKPRSSIANMAAMACAISMPRSFFALCFCE